MGNPREWAMIINKETKQEKIPTWHKALNQCHCKTVRASQMLKKLLSNTTPVTCVQYVVTNQQVTIFAAGRVYCCSNQIYLHVFKSSVFLLKNYIKMMIKIRAIFLHIPYWIMVIAYYTNVVEERFCDKIFQLVPWRYWF